MARLIDADKLGMYLNDIWLSKTPGAADIAPVRAYKEALADGLKMAIEALDNAPTVGGWISVEDRLPDQAGYECLVCGVNIFGQRRVFTAFTGYGEPGWWTNHKNHMRREIDETDNRVSPVWTITHWMPLPEPPEVSKDE